MRKMEIPVCLETTVCARSNRDLAHFFPQRVYVRSGKSLKIVCVFVGPLSLQLRMFANKSASARSRTGGHCFLSIFALSIFGAGADARPDSRRDDGATPSC